MIASSSQPEIVHALRQALERHEAARRPQIPAFSTCSSSLDRLLPEGGLPRGALVEYLAGVGSGATALAMIAATKACQQVGSLMIIDGSRNFYPPAAVTLGVDLNDAILIQPRSQRDYLWALHQSLSCPGVGAVVSWPEKLDGKAFRSLQLAAEKSQATGLFVRPGSARGHPTWSEVQLLVETLAAHGPERRLRVEVIRCRHGKIGASVELELSDETGSLQASRFVPVDSPLARATLAQRTSGA